MRLPPVEMAVAVLIMLRGVKLWTCATMWNEEWKTIRVSLAVLIK